MRHYLLAVLGVLAVMLIVIADRSIFTKLAEFVEPAATFFIESVSVSDLHNAYAGQTPPKLAASGGKLRILIVPGHDPSSGGTAFAGVYERDVVVDIANELAARLASDPHLEVIVSRDKTIWSPVFVKYFSQHWEDIRAFMKSQYALMHAYKAQGAVTSLDTQVYHNNAPSDVATRLYGVNKWASENGVGLTIHLHINDYAGHGNKVGRYTGYVVYVPDPQYSNATSSRAVGEAIAKRLAEMHSVSTVPGESAGVVTDQDLIAVGSNNSADSAAVLIEYGYMYEPQFINPLLRPQAVTTYAEETYEGIEDFLRAH
jgi:N-acetylmuramoyl-L-alanine amidase